MSDKKATLYPEHHAVLFGLIARETLHFFGQEQGDALLLEMVRTYAAERGRRMRLRVDAHGDTPCPLNYMAYGEWAGNTGFRKEIIHLEPFYSYRVLECPWCNAWKAHGLEKYGPYYCRCADVAIVEGFDPALTLEMPVWLSDGPYCQFSWPEFAMTDENQRKLQEKREELGDSCLQGWDYHTAHMRSTMFRVLRAADAGLAAEAEDAVCWEFERIFGEEAVQLMEAQMGQDFTKLPAGKRERNE